MQGSKDIRRGERRPLEGVVQVSWQARPGETRMMRAKCLNVSDNGLRVECAQKIDLRTNVYVQAPTFGLMGNATVRYCQPCGTKHVIGLMFGSLISQADRGRHRASQNSNQAPIEPGNHD